MFLHGPYFSLLSLSFKEKSIPYLGLKSTHNQLDLHQYTIILKGVNNIFIDWHKECCIMGALFTCRLFSCVVEAFLL